MTETTGQDPGEFLLGGRVAVVTGGTRGIGLAIVRALYRAGSDCVFTYTQSASHAASLEEEIRNAGRRALAVRADVCEYEKAVDLAALVKETFGRVDLLVNNAGITRDRSLMMMDPGDWQIVIDTDLTGVFNLSRVFISTFLRQQGGSIINISSVSALRPRPGQVSYAAAKAGVVGLTKCLAREVAAYNVRVNAVAPGFIETDMTAALTEKRRKKLVEEIPARRFGTPEDVASMVVFLASDLAGYVTGQVIPVDGGLSV